MPRQRSPQHRAPRTCASCPAVHGRNAPWCADCSQARAVERNREHSRNRNRRRDAAAFGDQWAPSKPPPPPDGFNPRDLMIGRPVE